MKLETSNNNSTNIIRHYDEKSILVNDERLTESFIITADRLIKSWKPNHFSELSIADFSVIIELDPEIIILGSGKKLHFPETPIMASIMSLGIGFEVMDTYAACRCYTILVAEGRKVSAGLILEI